MTGKERRGRAASTSRGRNDAIFFKERETTNVLWGSSLYSSHPSLHSLPVYSTCHLPCCHGYGSTCCRQEEEEERKRSWGQESKKGMKRKGGKTKRGLKKKTRTGQEGWGKEAKERDEAVRKGGEGIKGKKAGHSFLQVIPTRAAS